jgi:hypothetical protein
MDIPWFVRISGLPMALAFSAFRNDRIGTKIFAGLFVWSSYACFRLFHTPSFWLAALFAFVGASSALQIVIRPLLRGSIRGGHWRNPTHLQISRVLSQHAILSIVGEPVVLIPFAIALFDSVLNNLIKGLIEFAVLAIFYMPFARFYILNVAILQLARVWVSGDFRIIIFRRFLDGYKGEEFSRFDSEHKRILLPALGAYGNLVLVHNESLLSAEAGPNPDSEEVLSQLRDAVLCEGHNWQENVLSKLKTVDLAVFHWATVPTQNMLWEFERACQILPTSRLLFVESQPPWGLKEFLESHFSAAIKPREILLQDRIFGYAEPFHDFMKQLK